MTTQLAATPIDPAQMSLLDLVTDTGTPLGSLHRDDFEAACRAVADVDGWVNPNLVSAELHRRFGEINPNQYSAMWSSSCAKAGFMDTHRDRRVPIDSTRSRGNGAKEVPMRRLRSAS